MKTILLAILCSFSGVLFSMNNLPDTIMLPAPDTSGGMPLMQALHQRSTHRSFSDKELSLQQLSDLLWAAFGINRSDSGRRTAPSARNSQETDLYVALPAGTFLYNARLHRLIPVLGIDIRSDTGHQPFTQDAAVVIIMVTNFDKLGANMSDENKLFYSATDVGYISQNMYLYCASEGLASVVLGSVNREQLARHLNLNENQKVLLTQCVGYRK